MINPEHFEHIEIQSSHVPNATPGAFNFEIKEEAVETRDAIEQILDRMNISTNNKTSVHSSGGNVN